MSQEQVQQYELCLRCLRCKMIFKNTSFSDICKHESRYHFFQINNEGKQHLSFEDKINEINTQNEEKKSNTQCLNLKDLLTLIEDNSSLALGTINLQKPTFSNLLKTLHINNWELISAEDLIKYIQEKQLYSSNTINAIKFLIQFFNIQITISQKRQIRFYSNMSVKKRDSNPHNIWKIELIQQVKILNKKFIDQLLIEKKIILAFRVYILYYLAARISKLEQIKFETIISNGIIKYLPKKQIKRGLKAQRCFILPQIVCQVTQKLITMLKISPLSTINIGKEGKIIQSKSFQNDLKRQIKQLKLKIVEEVEHQNYMVFLEQFQYHDLRYSRLNHMSQQGYSKEIIRKFVSHKKIETTEHYLRNNQAEYIDFNEKQVKNLQDQIDTKQNQIMLEFNFCYYYDQEKEIQKKSEQFI